MERLYLPGPLLSPTTRISVRREHKVGVLQKETGVKTGRRRRRGLGGKGTSICFVQRSRTRSCCYLHAAETQPNVLSLLYGASHMSYIHESLFSYPRPLVLFTPCGETIGEGGSELGILLEGYIETNLSPVMQEKLLRIGPRGNNGGLAKTPGWGGGWPRRVVYFGRGCARVAG